MNIIEMLKPVAKWVPVIFAGGMAIFEAIDAKEKEEKMNDMERRIAELENK